MTYATWSGGLFEAAYACDVSRRCWAICVSLTIGVEARREGETWVIEERCRPCGNEGGRRGVLDEEGESSVVSG